MQRFRPDGREPLILLNPGPSNVTEGVAQALLRGDLCHREPEFSELQTSIRARLVRLFASPDYGAVLLTGSGTSAMEATVSSLVGPGEGLLILDNGVYGERLEQIATAHGIRHTVVRRGWSEPHDPAEVRAALEADPGLGAVVLVHHETTTGLLNPVREVAEVARGLGRRVLVDSVSGLAGEALDVAGWGIDAVIGSANKCVRGIAGLAFVLATRRLLEQAAAWPKRTLYLHLPTYFAKQEVGDTPFTPAVQAAYAFEVALEELEAEGVGARVAHNLALSSRLRTGLEAAGYALYLPEGRRSATITTVRLPEGWSYERVHDALKAKGFVIYAGQGPLKSEAFRLATLGVLGEDDVDRLVGVLATLKREGSS